MSPLRRLSACLLALAMLTGCGTNPENHPTSKTANPPARQTAAQELKQLVVEFNNVADEPAIRLTPSLGLKPVAGFTQTDVDALAKRAVDILTRSGQPRLTRMAPDTAIDYIYAHQYPATTYDFKSNAASLASGYDWQWIAASRYNKTPTTPPKIIKVNAAVTTGKGHLDDGTPARYLQVTVQIHALQQIPSDHGTAPIVVRRTVQASGYRPRGGPNWWPTVVTRTGGLFGNSGCALFKGARLVPLTDPDVMRTDLADLKISIANKDLIPENFGNFADPKATRKYIQQTCANEKQH